MGTRVFISYSRRDREVARKLVRRLREAGFEPWFDDDDLIVGESYAQQIEAAILDCDAFVALFGPHGWGNFQLQEIDVAIHHARRLIPVVLPGADPKELSGLMGTRHAVLYADGVGDESEEAFTRIVAGLEGRRVGQYEPESLLRNEESHKELARPTRGGGVFTWRRAAVMVSGVGVVLIFVFRSTSTGSGESQSVGMATIPEYSERLLYDPKIVASLHAAPQHSWTGREIPSELWFGGTTNGVEELSHDRERQPIHLHGAPCDVLFDSGFAKAMLVLPSRRDNFCSSRDIRLSPAYLGTLGGEVFSARQLRAQIPALGHDSVVYASGTELFEISCEQDPASLVYRLSIAEVPEAAVRCEIESEHVQPIGTYDGKGTFKISREEYGTYWYSVWAQRLEFSFAVRGIELRWSEGRSFSQRCSDYPTYAWLEPMGESNGVWWRDYEAWELWRVDASVDGSGSGLALTLALARCELVDGL